MESLATLSGLKQRVIRVFISSTFQDMKEEREELVKRVFPKLRKICEQRGITWGTVDLRWGITDEQSAEGKVLPICFREIDECRPYFIGMLADRYGYVPEEIPWELTDRVPWLLESEDRSITELEMLYGFLNDSKSPEYARFYFRDPLYMKSRDPEYKSDDPERLADLKDRIRATGVTVRENYPDPRELGKLVHDDLLSVINELFPSGSELDPLDRDVLDHEMFAHARHKVYIERQEYFDRLNAHVEGGDEPLVILGESGSGKSALLANWISLYRETNPGTLCVTHFIGATPYSADWTAMLRRIMGELKRRYSLLADVPSESRALKADFANWLHIASVAAGKKNERVIIVLDALNQLEDKDSAQDLGWLPPVIPGNIRLIISTLPGRSLDELNKRDWSRMEVQPLRNEERRSLIVAFLNQFSKSLDVDRLDKIVLSEQTRNPLFLLITLSLSK